MRKLFVRYAAIPLALLAGSAASWAQSSVTIFGVVDSAVELAKSGGRQTRLVSGGYLSSRLGFRGVEDLGGGLSAVFRLEMGINSDNGSLGQGGLAFGRESSVGLSGRNWGTVTFGRLPTPYYQNQLRTDAFRNTMTGSTAAITRNTATASRQLFPLYNTPRFDNAMKYSSPNLGGFRFEAMGNLDEDVAGVGQGLFGMAGYTTDWYDIVLAAGRAKPGPGGLGSVRGYIFGGSAQFGPSRVYLGLMDERNDCTNCTGALARAEGVTGSRATEFRMINLGVRHGIGAWTIVGQLARIQDRSEYTAPTGNRDANWFALGAEYALSKRSVVWTSVGTVNNKNGSAYVLSGGSSQQPATFTAAPGNPRSRSLQVGLSHTF